MSEESLLFNNNLQFKCPPMISLVDTRVKQKHYFDKRSYKEGDLMRCDINSKEYIDFENSSIVLDVEIIGEDLNYDSDYDFHGEAHGSGLNIFRSIRVDHKSGETMVDIEDLDFYNQMELTMKYSRQYLNTIGSDIGYNAVLPSGNLKKKLVIPLKHLCGLFDPLNKVYMPPQLAKFKLELQTSDFKRVFRSTWPILQTTQPISYVINNIFLNLEHITLNPSTTKEMVRKASAGQSYIFEDVHSQYKYLPKSLTVPSVNFFEVECQRNLKFFMGIHNLQ